MLMMLRRIPLNVRAISAVTSFWHLLLECSAEIVLTYNTKFSRPLCFLNSLDDFGHFSGLVLRIESAIFYVEFSVSLRFKQIVRMRNYPASIRNQLLSQAMHICVLNMQRVVLKFAYYLSVKRRFYSFPNLPEWK